MQYLKHHAGNDGPIEIEDADMSNVKEKMTEVIQSLPDDASYEEIMRELAFDKMVSRGLEDVQHGRVLSNEEMERRIRSWGSFPHGVTKRMQSKVFV